MTPLSEMLNIMDMLDFVGLHSESDELNSLLIKEAGDIIDVEKFIANLSADLAQHLSNEQRELVMHLVKRTFNSLKPEVRPHSPQTPEPKTYMVHPVTLAENIAALWDDKINIEDEIRITDKAIKTTQNPADIKKLHDKLRRLEMDLSGYKQDIDRNNLHINNLKRDYPQGYAQYLAAKKSILEEKKRMQKNQPRGEREYQKDYTGFEGLRRMEEESIKM